MDVAVFSDIHSNHTAFQTCVDYCMARGITRFILLGDYVSDCPYPQKTMELIHTLRGYFETHMVRGNREEYLLNYRKKGAKGWKPGSGSGSLLYTYENLTDKDFELFDSLPIYDIWKDHGIVPVEYCHGSPTESNGSLMKDKRTTKRVLASLRTDYLLHGHNHTQESYYYRGKRSVNPGSIGIPWDHGGKTQFAIMHGKGDLWEDELIQLEYKRNEIIKEFQTSGLAKLAPAWAALAMHTIRTGKDFSQTVLLRAMQLCTEETGEARWPDIPEQYYAYALRESYIDLGGKEIPRKKK